MEEKQSIILKHIRDGKSQRQIQRETGIARETIRKYTRIYEAKLKELGVSEDDFDKVDLIADLVTAPKYKSSPRTKNTMTNEVIERIKGFFKENEQKRYRGLSKQQMKKIDMYEALVEEGFTVSYSSVLKAASKIERRKKEAFIKQEYAPGDVVEFDFGTVKLYTEDGLLREYQLAIFTSAYSNYRWARLFPKQDTACFLEAHAKFFDNIKGVFRTVVYDNTRVAVKKFIGHTEKEATEALLKLSLYYKFDFRFCNAYRGNEKGHVERSVDFIRRKAFSKHLHFDSLIDANTHLENVLESINSISKGDKKKSSFELLEEEREYFLPEMPIYETARVQNFRVSKYSTIMIDSCYYSVPDSFVGVMVRCKIYSTKIVVSYNEDKIAEHVKQTGINKWKIDIQHYVNTLFKKPKSLVNSTAFKQLDYKLKEIYNNYFKSNDREFLNLISLVGTYGLSSIEKAIKHLQTICPNNISIDKIEFICTTKEDDKVIYLTDYESDIVQNSINMLNEFNNLLDN